MLGKKVMKCLVFKYQRVRCVVLDLGFPGFTYIKQGDELTWKAWRTSAVCLCSFVWSQFFNTGLKVTSFWTL